jgi:hypothetical protein
VYSAAEPAGGNLINTSLVLGFEPLDNHHHGYWSTKMRRHFMFFISYFNQRKTQGTRLSGIIY